MAVLSVCSVAVTAYVKSTLAAMEHFLSFLGKRIEVRDFTLASMEGSCVAIVTVSILSGSMESIHLLGCHLRQWVIVYSDWHEL